MGEWVVGIAMKLSTHKVVSGCGTITTQEVASCHGLAQN
jgi:hypothetical protein